MGDNWVGLGHLWIWSIQIDTYIDDQDSTHL